MKNKIKLSFMIFAMTISFGFLSTQQSIAAPSVTSSAKSTVSSEKSTPCPCEASNPAGVKKEWAKISGPNCETCTKHSVQNCPKCAKKDGKCNCGKDCKKHCEKCNHCKECAKHCEECEHCKDCAKSENCVKGQESPKSEPTIKKEIEPTKK